MINFIICFHTQWEVFFQIKFHPGMKFYSFHSGMKLTCKQKFFHPWTSFIPGWDFVSVTCKRTLRLLFTVIPFSLSLSYYGIMLDKINLFVWFLQDVVRLIISRGISSGELSLFKSLVPKWLITVSRFCLRVGMI